jgi:lysophospholipase L1-like esterase
MPWLIAAAMLVVPLGVGAVVGTFVSDLPSPRRRKWAALALALTPLVAAWIVAPLLHEYSLHDLVFSAALVGAGVLSAGWPYARAPRWQHLALAGATTAVGVGILELWCRSHPAPIPPAEPAERANLTFDTQARAFQCLSLYPDASQDPGHFGQHETPDFPPKTEGKRRVLHIGDSMTAGGDVPLEDRFPMLLSAMREPSEEHLNLGVSNTDTDAQLVIARTWIERLKGDAVFLHVLASNDISGMDQPFPCCDAQPLLDYATTPPASRCREATWRYTRALLLRQGPPPYALRIAAPSFELAHQVAWSLERLARKLDFSVEARHFSREEKVLHFRAALLGIRDEARRVGVPLVVVVMPLRELFDGAPSLAEQSRWYREHALAVARELGIATLDAQPLFEDALRRDPGTWLFQPTLNNPHFNVAGHHLYANWIAAQTAPPKAR